MKLFYDLRLGYFVGAPGVDAPLAEIAAKAGDEEEIVIQFGRSSDPTGTASIIESASWTAENLAGGTVITVGIKEDGVYSDGDILATTSTFTHDAVEKTYTGALDLNTTEINTALNRDDADDANDTESISCNFECTFQIGGSGGWRSSVLPVPFKLYHDVLSGSEGTPTNAGNPDEYLLKASGIEWLPTVTSKIGGTAADLDAVPTTTVAVGKIVMFADADDSNVLRVYELKAGTDAESSPTVIRPDDYNSSTNAKVWMQRQVDGELLLPATVSQAEAEAGTETSTRMFTPERVKQAIAALESTKGLSSSVANEIVLFNGTDGRTLKRATGTGLAKITSGVLSTATAATDFVAPGAITSSGLTMATSRILGRTTASTGATEEISVGSNMTLTGGTLNAVDNSLPTGVVSLSTDTTLVVGTHNKAYIECTGAMTTVTIAPQSSSAWTDNSFFWIANRLDSGSITIARGSGVLLILTNVSADFTLTSGSRPVLIWRSAENTWRILG